LSGKQKKKTLGAEELKIKQKRRNDSELLDSLKPLVEPYQKNYWYWEIVEILKRLTISAGISIMFPGTPLQIVIGVLLAIMFYRAYYRAKPYISKSDEDLTLAGDWMLIISFLYTYTITSDGLDGVHNKESTYNMLDTMFGCLSISFVFLNVIIIIRDYFQSKKDDLEANEKKEAEKRDAVKKFIATQEIHHYRGQAASFNDVYFLSYFRKKLEKFPLKQLSKLSFIIFNRQIVDNNLYKLKLYPKIVFFYSLEESTVMHSSNLLTPSLGEMFCAFPITDRIADRFIFVTRSSRIIPPHSNNNKSLSRRKIYKAISQRYETFLIRSNDNQNIISQGTLKLKQHLYVSDLTNNDLIVSVETPLRCADNSAIKYSNSDDNEEENLDCLDNRNNDDTMTDNKNGKHNDGLSGNSNNDNNFEFDSEAYANWIFYELKAQIINEAVFDAIETVDLENFKKSGHFKKNINRFLKSVIIIDKAISLTLSDEEVNYFSDD